MNEKEWILLADVALQAAILTLEQEAQTPQGRKRPHLSTIAEYLKSIREQKPKEG